MQLHMIGKLVWLSIFGCVDEIVVADDEIDYAKM